MRSLRAEVVVIGGGATGAGILRDLAMRGYDALLVERADLAQGTTARFHGLLHSGARYIVSDPESARECAVENKILRNIHFGDVEDTGGLFVATPADDPAYAAQFVQHAAAVGVRATEISVSEALRREPRLNPGITRAFEVADGSIDGWAVAWGAARSAMEYSGRLMTYTEVTAIHTSGGQVTSVSCVDRRTGEDLHIETGFVINAGGPWAGRIAALAGCSDVEVVPGRGIMIAMAHRLVNTVVTRCGYPGDGDLVVPAHTVCIIGTTDVRAADPDKLPIPPGEVQQMLDAGEALIPGFRKARALHAWAGARPLLLDRRVADHDTRHMSRTMAIIDHAARDELKGFLTVTGGKLTTYRLMAEKTVDLFCAQRGEHRACRTAREHVGSILARGDKQDALRWLHTHSLGTVPSGEDSIGPDDQIICECELMTVRHFMWPLEQAPQSSLDDLRRQLRLGMGPCQGGFCAARAAGICASTGKRTAAEANAMLREFVEHRWIGLWPILYQDQLRQWVLDAWLLTGLGMFWRPWAQTRPAALAAGDAPREAPLEKRSGLRRLVIGAGLSGLFAALLAAQAGEQVTLVYLGVGGLPLSPGTIDVFAGEDLPDEHPYRLIGAGRVAAAVRHLAELVPELLAGDPASNVSLPTALGTLRPTCLAPQSMLAGADLSTPTVIVGFTQLKDFSAARTAGALQAATSAPVRHLVLDLPPRQGEIDANAVKYARAFDEPAFQELFAEKLRPLLRPGEKVGLPAVLGLRPGTWKDTAERLGAAVFEIPLAPTSVPGLRLHNTLLAMVKQVGVRVISGSRATGHTASQGRIDSVDIAAAGAPIRVWADEVILATGGFESQGLEVDSYGRMRETSFGLPVTGSAEVLEDCWADHPLLRAGLRVDAAMRPVDGDGNPVFENLRAVGGLLAGANRIAELSGDGIALASAWAAVHAQPAAAQSQTAGDRAAVADSALVPLRTAVDQCLKCTICEAHCPVMAVTPLFPGPKFIGPQAERFRNPDVCEPESVSFCSGCGTCTLVCPQGVPVAALNSRAKARYKTSGGMPLRDRLIGRTTLMGQVMTPIAPLANAALANGPLRSLLERAIGVHRDAPMPPAQSRTFGSWWHNHKPQTSASRGQVVFFHGCAGGYFEVETSIRTVEVLERLGYEVLVPKQGCCGLAMQSNGLFDQASQAVRTLAGQLTAIPDVPIISASGSCTGMLKHEAREIMGVTAPEVTAVGNRVRDVMQFLRDVHETGGLPRLSRIDLRVLYHAPCQVKNQGMGLPALDVLRLIPGLEVAESNATCCGIAGTYGMKAELYDIAQAVGQPLFDQAQGFDLVACDTETCRWQIRKAARKPVEHPISLVHQALGG